MHFLLSFHKNYVWLNPPSLQKSGLRRNLATSPTPAKISPDYYGAFEKNNLFKVAVTWSKLVKKLEQKYFTNLTSFGALQVTQRFSKNLAEGLIRFSKTTQRRNLIGSSFKWECIIFWIFLHFSGLNVFIEMLLKNWLCNNILKQ